MSAMKGPLPENRKAPPERTIVAMKLLSEMRPGSVIQALMEQFKIGRSSAKRAIQMARHVMLEEEEEIRPHIRAVMIARLEKIVDRAEEEKDFSAAVRGMRELVNIYGLSAPEELRVTLDPKTTKAMEELSDDQLQALALLGGVAANPTEH